MSLTESERRNLESIEKRLTTQDPRLAQTLTPHRRTVYAPPWMASAHARRALWTLLAITALAIILLPVAVSGAAPLVGVALAAMVVLAAADLAMTAVAKPYLARARQRRPRTRR